MSITLQTINIGSAPEDGTGDTARDAFDKCNDNFTALSTAVGGAQYLFPGTNLIQIANAENVGGNVILYDTDHATLADDIEFRQDNTVRARYDASDAQWEFLRPIQFTAAVSTTGTIYRDDATGTMILGAGTSTITGATLTLYGGSHATQAGDVVLSDATQNILTWDKSATQWAAAGSIDYTGDVTAETLRVDNADTVAGLPGSPVVGQIARVTDANSPSVGSTVTGGGAAAALVWYNGSNWTVIGV